MLTLQQAKQAALFVAMAGAMVYQFLEEIDNPKVRVITNARAPVRRTRRHVR